VLMLLTSPGALGAPPNLAVTKVLSDLKTGSNAVSLISNQNEPA